MINYILIAVIIILLFKLNSTESFTDYEKDFMSSEIYKNKDKIKKYTNIKKELNWLDPVMHSDAVELFHGKKLTHKNLKKIFE